MKLTIDNLDGNGAIDYSASLAAKQPLKITRRLNEPSLCSFTLVLAGTTLSTPLRNGRVIVTDISANTLFTGYVAAEPASELAGAGTEGQIYLLQLSAVSDEILLSRLSVPQTRGTAGQTVTQLVQDLTNRVNPSALTVSSPPLKIQVGHFLPDPGATWSQNAGELAAIARTAYYVQAGTMSLSPIGTVTHTLSEADGTLQVQALSISMAKALANDVTVCGEEEPAAYVTEIFQGDGTTVLFDLTRLPYFPESSHSKPLTDLFQGPSINPVLWGLIDPGSHLSITSSGLTCNGGTGNDGETVIAAIDPLEIGGALVIEASGVLFGAQAAGILCGLYFGPVSQVNCFAGFLVTQSNGATVVTPLIQGSVAGASFSPVAGHLYTLRIRTFSIEVQRVLASYYATGDNGSVSFGGGAVAASANLVFEIQDTTDGVAGAVTVLYDGSVSNAPTTCTFAPIDSTNLVGSIASITVTEEGAVWVTGQIPGSAPGTLRLGTTAQGAQCRVERAGKLRFYAASVPAVNTTITVTYRTSRRSVARIASAASIAAEAKGQMPGTSVWAGSVTSPPTRSSADCENAAFALLASSTSRAAAFSGRYSSPNLQLTQDVWPGDVLAVSAASAGLTANLVVREVQIEVPAAAPDITKYTIAFANDWADALSMKLSKTVPKDAWIPQQPMTAVTALPSLAELSVTSVTASAIQVAAGVSPPSGGGFEVRRRDWAFHPGTDSDLVLRSPVPNFTIPREAPIEQYFIRQYDGASPPHYSRFSSAVFVTVPM